MLSKAFFLHLQEYQSIQWFIPSIIFLFHYFDLNFIHVKILDHVRRTSLDIDTLVENRTWMSFKGDLIQLIMFVLFVRHKFTNASISIRYVCTFRLEPVIIELERQRAPVVVISHQVLSECLLLCIFNLEKYITIVPNLTGSVESIVRIFCW